MAAALIRALRPDVVTLNEVCREDVSVLERAMSAAHRSTTVASTFKPAADRRNDGPTRCLNGQQFGDGVLALVPGAAPGYRTSSGIYPVQDPTDPEERVWLCIELASRFSACTTHTASTSTAIALAQCRYFLNSVVPRMRRQGGDEPVILGADLNLPAGHSPSPQACLPHGYQREDDGARQDVVTSPGAVVRSRTLVDMRSTTDHPELLVEVDLPRHVAP
jgi:endonuclease/exonuclease/phosphatase family metal-dependent hydrolase